MIDTGCQVRPFPVLFIFGRIVLDAGLHLGYHNILSCACAKTATRRIRALEILFLRHSMILTNFHQAGKLPAGLTDMIDDKELKQDREWDTPPSWQEYEKEQDKERDKDVCRNKFIKGKINNNTDAQAL